ncbi:MAG TPA: hypothetical protein VGM93_07855 [Acidimicrobiales bacterium]
MQRLLQELPVDTVTTVSESPLSRSLRTSFEMAIDADAEWLLICDADVVPVGDGLRRVLRQATEMPSHYLQMSPRVQDLTFRAPLTRGVRVYRVSLLPVALEVLASGTHERRPESGLINDLVAVGHPSGLSHVVVGLHDFEQWHRDLYRKGYFFAHKHVEKLSNIVARAHAEVEAPEDLRSLLLGLADGLLGPDPNADVRPFDQATVTARLAEHGIAEKAPLVDHAALDAVFDRCQADAPSRGGYWQTNPFPPRILDQWPEFRRRDGGSAVTSMLRHYRRLGPASLLPALGLARRR